MSFFQAGKVEGGGGSMPCLHCISAEGKGESDLKVKCGQNCSDEEHQQNRRSEFLIVSGGPQAQK